MTEDNDSRIAVLINPNSGGNRRSSKTPEVNRLRGIETNTMVFEVRDLGEMKNAIKWCQQAQVSILIIQGGDGTVQMALTILFQESADASYQPKLMLIPAGTTNMTHADVGCSLPLTVAVREAHRYLSGSSKVLSVVKRHALRISFRKSGRVVCGMFLGAGMIYSGILYCRQNIHTKGVRGSLGPGLAIVRFIRNWLAGEPTDECNVSITCHNGPKLDVKSSVMLMTTMQKLLLDLKPFWSRSNAPLKITVIEKRASANFTQIARMVRGKNPDKNNNAFQSVNCLQADVELNRGFTIDGELFDDVNQTQKLRVQAVGPIHFLT